MDTIYHHFIGIDVSKEWIDVSIDKAVFRIQQTKKDLAHFIKKHLKLLSQVLCVFESTGSHEKLLSALLTQESIVFHEAHPNKILQGLKGVLLRPIRLMLKSLLSMGK